ncbi:MAG: hypothetical protein Q8O72_16025 [Bacteroidales bacterium]|nr:hypothetical protein [Bacteroidales bacterium]
MKTIIQFFIALLLLHSISYAQDTIVKKTGKKIICTIQQVNYDNIKYKNIGHENGSVFTIWKDQVAWVNHADGTTDTINDAQKSFKVDTTQSIKCVGRYFGYKINQSGHDLRNKEVRVLFKDHPEAYAKYKSGRRLSAWGSVISIPSAFVFGYELGTALMGTSPEPGLLILGGVGATLGIIMTRSGKLATFQSVDLYNSKVQGKPTVQLDFRLTENGAGLCVSF